MKTNHRRNLALLAFIGILAAVYAVILLLGQLPEDTEIVEEPSFTFTPITIETFTHSSVRSSDTVAKQKFSKERKSSHKSKTRPINFDNLDILDSPVPSIHR